MMFFKRALSIRVMVGVGILLALVLPRTVGMVLAALALLPSLVLHACYYFGIVEDPNPKKVVKGRMTAVIDVS